MTAAAAVLLTAAVVIVGYTPAYLVTLALRKRRDEQAARVDAEWFAVLAATETSPIYDRMVCEEIERAEGWSS